MKERKFEKVSRDNRSSLIARIALFFNTFSIIMYLLGLYDKLFLYIALIIFSFMEVCWIISYNNEREVYWREIK